MAREIVWSYEATDDLDAIAAYIARDSAFYAASFMVFSPQKALVSCMWLLPTQ